MHCGKNNYWERGKHKEEDLKDTSFPQLSEPQIELMAQARSEFIKDQQPLKVSSKAELEGEIGRIWQESIGLEKLGVNDNFFDVVGHSLVMIEIRNKITEVLGKQFSVVALFTHPTIGSLADYLTRELHE
jgi:hypothetical protein